MSRGRARKEGRKEKETKAKVTWVDTLYIIEQLLRRAKGSIRIQRVGRELVIGGWGRVGALLEPWREHRKSGDERFAGD